MRKLFKNSKRLKALVITLIITTISLFGVSYSVFAKTTSGSVNDGATTTSSTPTDAENVYVMTKANGNEYQRIVSADGTLHYKGYDSYTLPVSMKISYTLDGKSITPKELAGKSGHVVIHISYANNIRSGGVNVPFLVLTGLAMDDEHFSNISVDNGKTMDDGSRNIVVGFALPGMQSSLGVSSGDLDIPESVTISCDTDKYSVDTMYTVATSQVFKDIDMSDVSSLGDIKSQLSKLTSGIDQLVSGINQINSGASQLSNGVKSLDTQLKTPLTAAAGKSLKAQAKASVVAQFGSKTDSKSYYNQIKNQAATTFYDTLTNQSNITAAQKQVLANLNASAIASSAASAAASSAQAQVDSAADFKTGTGDLWKAVYAGATQQYIGAYLSDTTVKERMASAITTLTGQLVANNVTQADAKEYAKAYITSQYTENAKTAAANDTSTNGPAYIATSSMNTIKSSIVGAASSAASGTASSVSQQVASKVTESVIKSVAYSAKDTVGTSLADSVEQAAISAAQSATTTTVASTKFTIAKNIEYQGLVSGASELAAGTNTLKTSVDSMVDQVMGKLSKLSKSDLTSIIKNAESISSAAKSYNSFGGNGSYNSVTFIYKVDEVSPK